MSRRRPTCVRPDGLGSACARFGAIIFAALTLAACTQTQDPGRPPNIVVIITDDMGYNDLACFGSTRNETPRLDALASEGTRFTSFYAGASVCSPSRAALLTGCYPPRIGVDRVYRPGGRSGLNPDETTIAEMLRANGYKTACVGKWHLGAVPGLLPTDQGFDRFLGITHNVTPRSGAMSSNQDQVIRDRAVGRFQVQLYEGSEVKHYGFDPSLLTETFTNAATDFIGENHAEPFFLYFAHFLPHIPLLVSDQFYVSDPQQAYGAAVREIDWSVGEILDALEKNGVRDNTLVVFTSDHGPWLEQGHHAGSAEPYRGGKAGFLEGSVRVPTITSWPGHVKAGRQSDALVSAIDLLPTIANLTSSQLPMQKIDGVDASGLFGGTGSKSPRAELFYLQAGLVVGVRDTRWKLVGIELYDLTSDPTERKNVATKHPEIVTRLRTRIEAFSAEIENEKRPEGEIPYKDPLGRDRR